MATPLFFQIHQQGNNTTASGTNFSFAGAGITPVVVGFNVIVRIATTGPLNIRFGPPGTNNANPNDILMPVAGVEFFDMGTNFNTIVLGNTAASPLTVNVSIVSRQ